jgi:hypothetical protein
METRDSPAPPIFQPENRIYHACRGPYLQAGLRVRDGRGADVPVRIKQVARAVAGFLGFSMDSAAPALPLW